MNSVWKIKVVWDLSTSQKPMQNCRWKEVSTVNYVIMDGEHLYQSLGLEDEFMLRQLMSHIKKKANVDNRWVEGKKNKNNPGVWAWSCSLGHSS